MPPHAHLVMPHALASVHAEERLRAIHRCFHILAFFPQNTDSKKEQSALHRETGERK
jgi:hypothetical protein